MRWIFLPLCLTIFSLAARGQEQDRKLADRLLRPDMSLVNPAQNKKFVATDGTPADKQFAAKSFSTGEARTKSFAGSKGFFARIFGTKNFTRAEAAANAKANADIAYATTEFASKESSLIRISSESARKAPSRDYADQHPFRGTGTRQEVLNQQQENKPLTIDEVRELLNRNK